MFALHTTDFASRRLPRTTRRTYSLRAQRGGTRFATLLVLAALGTGGVYAYRHFFQRGGEAATQLIPSDALVVVTLDATPSANQVGVFKRIADACRAEHLDTTLENMVGRMQGSSPLARDLRPLTMGSAAYALLKPGANGSNAGSGNSGRIGIAANGDNAWFVAVSDTGRVQEVLNHDAQKNSVNGLDYYTVGGETRCMTVIGRYLVSADRPEDLSRIEGVRKGETPAIANEADYKQARAALPSDSNIMLFVSAEALGNGGQNAQNGNQGASGSLLQGGQNPMQRTRYLAMGFAIHDRGIDSVMRMPAEPPAGTEGQEVSHIAPFDTNLLGKMPSGAYGILAVSQPGKYYHYARALANVDSHFRQSLDEGARQFERETGLSVTRDILPGANGNVALAVYPDADNPQQNVDGLLVMDDANGADPAALADRLRSYVERESERHGGHAWRYTSENRNGVLIWTLNPEAQQDIQRSLGSGVSQARDQAGIAPSSPSVPLGSEAPTPPQPEWPSTSNNPAANTPAENPAGQPDSGNTGPDANRVPNPEPPNQPDSRNDGTHGRQDVDRSGDSGLRNGGNSSRQSNDVDVHIHAGSDGRIYDDTFDLHHGTDSVHADRNGMEVHTGEGDSLRLNRNGLRMRAHDGSHLEITPNSLDLHAHGSGNPSGNTTSGGGMLSAPGQNAPRANTAGQATPDAGVQQAMRNKTVAYAQIGHALLVASSRRMLERAIDAYQNGSGTMANDPGYEQMRQRVTAGAQNAILINLPGILEAARPVLTQALDNNHNGIGADDILHLAGDAGNGLVMTQQYDGKTFQFTCFLPVDYEKAIHIMRVISSQ